MKVKCIDNQKVETQLTLNKEYEVITESKSFFRVIDDIPLTEYEKKYGKFATGYSKERFVVIDDSYNDKRHEPVVELKSFTLKEYVKSVVQENETFTERENDEKLNAQMGEIDQHYNFFYYLTPEDREKDYIKIDPYFVANQWNFNKNDPTGCIFHIFKTCARFGSKNTKAREIEAMYKTIKRLAELEGIILE